MEQLHNTEDGSHSDTDGVMKFLLVPLSGVDLRQKFML